MAIGDEKKNIDIFIANVSDGNVGTGSADIFSTKVLVGAFHKCKLQSMSHGNEVDRGVFGQADNTLHLGESSCGVWRRRIYAIREQYHCHELFGHEYRAKCGV